MPANHREQVVALLAAGASRHAELLAAAPPGLSTSLPVDAQGLTQAIDHLAAAAGLSAGARRELLRPHALNPAVMHARVYGGAPLARDTVIASFVEGARVRAEALAALADQIGGVKLGEQVRELLVAHPPPLREAGREGVAALQATYAAQERAATTIAARLDAVRG